MLVVEGTISFDNSDPLYLKHFPGKPVVPGSLIVHSLSKIISSHGRKIESIGRARFHRFAKPESYPYKISISENEARWEINSHNGLLAKGVFSLCN